MQIVKVQIRNFRLLRHTTLDVKSQLSLLVGKNNTGKTSLIFLFEKFFGESVFSFTDFSQSISEALRSISEETDVTALNIRMILEIKYDANDNLENLSKFILDLDPKIQHVKILFECAINKKKLLLDLEDIPQGERKKYVEKNFSAYLSKEIYAFEDETDLNIENRFKLIKKDLGDVKQIINFQIIHAKRDVASSENSKGKGKILSKLTTDYFTLKNKDKLTSLDAINDLLAKMDTDLDQTYEDFFKPFLKSAKDFLNVENLKVSSNIESENIIKGSSQVVYGSKDSYLPEHLNGLGYLNILYLLLNIEILKDKFKKSEQDINLLFIEEPEAHTHPQMQYVFAEKIKDLLMNVPRLQTVMTTHSAHIVSQRLFEDIRYLRKIVSGSSENIEIKNFDSELREKYAVKEDFKFLKQYLTIQSAELFFADKVIFIEGTAERILLPYFIDKFDKSSGEKKKIGSQSVSILEVGANAKVFEIFLEFLNIHTLIITDIDSTIAKKSKSSDAIVYSACDVSVATHTSNYTLKHYFVAPELKDAKAYSGWFDELKNGLLKSNTNNIKLVYQLMEHGYHARSFEDSFIKKNYDLVKSNKDELWGLVNLDSFDSQKDIYLLTDEILDKKSDFASSVLFLALSKEVDWEIPGYIQNGFEWLVS